jgi:hypothetical protein
MGTSYILRKVLTYHFSNLKCSLRSKSYSEPQAQALALSFEGNTQSSPQMKFWSSIVTSIFEHVYWRGISGIVIEETLLSHSVNIHKEAEFKSS